MIRPIFILTLLCCGFEASAQKGDTVQKYLDQKLNFTTKSKGYFPAVAVKTPEAWFVKAMYPDTTVLLSAYFKDKNLRIKNGPYRLYHRKNIKAIEGTFMNNVAQGVWRYYYADGSLKDSGLLVDNVMAGNWQSWSPQGKLLAKVEYEAKPSRLAVNDGSGGTSALPGANPTPGMREGVSLGYHENGQLKDSGLYTANLRTGLWKQWHANGQLDAIGNVVMDRADGEWSYYRENGLKSTDETYKAGKLSSMTCYDSAGNKQGILCSVLKPPVPQGPFNDFEEYKLDNIFWPKKLDPNVQGTVKVKFVITKKGDLTNFEIISSPHKLLSEEVTRFFSSIEGWSPAISHNRVVDFPMEMEIPFLR